MTRSYYIRKKENFRTNEINLLKELYETYPDLTLTSIQIYNYYELHNFSEELIQQATNSIIADPVVDDIFETQPKSKYSYFIEPLPSQLDMRRESSLDCIHLIAPNAIDYDIKTGTLYLLEGINSSQFELVKPFFINPIENQIKNFNCTTSTFVSEQEKTLNLDKEDLETIFKSLDLAMDYNDFTFLVDEFKSENRIPTVGEVKIIDTYWSDHCRHTTFNTILNNIEIKDNNVAKAFNKLQPLLTKETTLMNIATAYAKYAIKNNIYAKKELTKEDNAISIVIEENNTEYLLQFKNETHNHPTEIEPFGGAATCIGGAIRDPLSGRAYVYQGMRIAGVGDIFEDTNSTLADKLYQRTISKKSALGFSSYGNQIGIPTLYNQEIYHPSYVAKHLELGCVVGVCERNNVTRKDPAIGDLIIMLGGKTGRDGIGGATGSSKLQTEDALIDSASEVQKGNAPQQRNLVRLFSIPEFSKTIKKSNDFGAGGVSVCALELADGVDIFLDKVQLKDQNMNFIDIALSESQERMAIIIDPSNYELVSQLCIENNIYYSNIGIVTPNNYVRMLYNDEVIYQFSRHLLNSGGAKKFQKIIVPKLDDINYNLYSNRLNLFNDRNLIGNNKQDEYFDATVLANTVLMPNGGKKQNIKTQISMAKIKGLNNLKSVVSYGFNPKMMEQNPFIGAQLAVIDSITKQVTVGVNLDDICLSFQEYFMRLNNDPIRFGNPFSALIGAHVAQEAFSIPALGGKDSMSGTYLDIDVVDTFVSFGLGVKKDLHVINNYFNNIDENIYLLHCEDPLDYSNLITQYNKYLLEFQKVSSAFTLGDNPLLSGLIKMAMDGVGFDVTCCIDELKCLYGSIVFTSKEELPFLKIGKTINNKCLLNGKIVYDEFNYNIFDSIYPKYETSLKTQKENKLVEYNLNPTKVETVNVLIPIFEGTNSYLELADEFNKLNCNTNLFVFNDKYDINIAIEKFINLLNDSQILAIPGGFSKADEPDGSAKYIVNFLNNDKVRNAIDKHLTKDKLIFGVCNGFQALLKSGILTPDLDEKPTLFYNDNQVHISKISSISYCQSNAPFFKYTKPGVYLAPISHGEGKLCISSKSYEKLLNQGQIISTYAYENPNQSDYNIEGIISPCGKIYGKMAHIERNKNGLYHNVKGNYDTAIFQSMVSYFKGE